MKAYNNCNKEYNREEYSNCNKEYNREEHSYITKDTLTLYDVSNSMIFEESKNENKQKKMSLRELMEVATAYNDIVIRKKENGLSLEIDRIRNDNIDTLKNKNLLEKDVVKFYANSDGYIHVVLDV